MEFIDTHTHLSDEAYRGEEDPVIERAVRAGVTRMIHPDVDSGERAAMFALCDRHPGRLFPMLGLYPGSVKEDWKDEMDRMLEWRDRDVVAIGEIGLDYHFSCEFKEEQKEALRLQLEMADKMDLPVNIHLRDAAGDFLDILKEMTHLHLRGNLHAFSGSAEYFRQVSAFGDWYVGIGGVLTFKKASIAEQVGQIPLERIVLETDSPYLAPTPLRGSRNESANIPLIAEFLASRKGVDVQTVAEVTSANARTLFPKIS